MFNRIWKKITAVLLAVTFAPIVYFGYHDLQSAKSSIQDEALKTIFLNSVTRSKDIERTFINAYSDINHLRHNLPLSFMLEAPSDSADTVLYWKSIVEKEFELFLNIKRVYSRIGLLNEYGDEVVITLMDGGKVMSLPEEEMRNRLSSRYYVRTAKLDDFGVAAMPMRSSVEPWRNLGKETLIRYSTKVFDSGGQPRGVIYIDLNGSEILYSLSSKSFTQKREAAMVTHEGKYIYNPNAEPRFEVPPKPYPKTLADNYSDKVVTQLLYGKPGVISDDKEHLFAFSPIYPQIGNRKFFYVIFDHYTRGKFTPKLNAVKKKYIVAGVLVFFMCVAVSVILSRVLTRKLEKLQEGSEKLRRGQLDHRLDIRSGDEIESLANAYNMMAETLEEYSRSLEKKVEERTEHVKRVERKLMQSEKMAALGFLSAGVAHEINNPISIIVTRLELIKREVEKGMTDNLKKDLDVLHNHALRIGKIAGSLLAFSREPSRECTGVDLNDVVDRVIGLIEHPIRNKGINLKCYSSGKIEPVWANAYGMEQVIYNIVYNAYQATPPEGTIILETAPADEGRVELEVFDTGCGIAEKELKRIFEPFFTTKEVGQGTGLGLSISFGMVEGFGGSLTVESELGTGTVFTITLDTAKEHKAKTEKELIRTET